MKKGNKISEIVIPGLQFVDRDGKLLLQQQVVSAYEVEGGEPIQETDWVDVPTVKAAPAKASD